MIDTINFTTSANFRPWVAPFNNLPQGWVPRACGVLSPDPAAQSIRLHCDKFDLSIFRMGTSVVSVSANLPKLLWGHNGRLIHTEDQFKQSIDWLNWILGQILIPIPPNDGLIPGVGSMTNGCHFTRIDLVWQFPASFGLIAALELASHPKIRSLQSIHRGQTVELPGSFLRIKAYEKFLQLKLSPGDLSRIHRLEFSLQNKALSEMYGTRDGRGYSRIDLEWCQHTMRKIAAELQGSLSIDDARGVNAFLAHVERKAPMLNLLEDYIRIKGLRRASARKLRKLVRRYRAPQSHAVHFSDLFGNQSWPAVLEVPMEEVERCHWRWLEQHQHELEIRNRT